MRKRRSRREVARRALGVWQLPLPFARTAAKAKHTVVDTEDVCPNCGSKLLKEGCWRCPNCQFQSCGFD